MARQRKKDIGDTATVGQEQLAAPEPVAEPTVEDHEAAKRAEGTINKTSAPGTPAKVRKVEEKRVTLPKRNLGGMYRCIARVRHGGKKHYPGTELNLTDAEARHYLEGGAVEPLD